MEQETNKKEAVEIAKSFQYKKISLLNQFFMRHIMIGNLYVILMFAAAVGFLVFLVFMLKLNNEIKITLISMIATFILTTSKTIIDKTSSTIQYLISLLTEEQRGLNKDLGIEIDKVELDHDDKSEK